MVTRVGTAETSADKIVTKAEAVVALRAIRALGALIVQGGLAKIPV